MQPQACPRCGAPVEPQQEYCFRCGASLPPGDAQRLGRVWSLLLLAALSAGTTAATVSAHGTRRATAPSLVVPTLPAPGSTAASTSSAATSATATTATPSRPASRPTPTVTTGSLPLAPGGPSTAAATTAAPPATTRPAPASPALVSWPAGTAGWTDILQSLPEAWGHRVAILRAQEARRAGLPQVGVLRSSDYSTLRNGYWVVFSGVYDTEKQATAGLSAARAHGFGGAYPAQVAK